jgi:hypothetical protein
MPAFAGAGCLVGGVIVNGEVRIMSQLTMP